MSRVGSWLGRFLREWTPVIIAVLLIRSFVVESFMVPTGSMEDTILVGDFMLVNKFVYGAKLPFSDQVIIGGAKPKRGDIIVFRHPADPDTPRDSLRPHRYARVFPEWLPLLPVFWDRQAGFFKWYTPLTLVKRCVAVAGDTVEYIDKKLYVNGKPQADPYALHKDSRMLPGLGELPQADYQRAWERRRFFRSELSLYVRDQFGPVVVPDGCVMAMGDNRDLSEDGRFWGPLPAKYIKGRPLVRYFSSSAVGNPPNIPRIVLSFWAIRLDRIGLPVR